MIRTEIKTKNTKKISDKKGWFFEKINKNQQFLATTKQNRDNLNK